MTQDALRGAVDDRETAVEAPSHFRATSEMDGAATQGLHTEQVHIEDIAVTPANHNVKTGGIQSTDSTSNIDLSKPDIKHITPQSVHTQFVPRSKQQDITTQEPIPQPSNPNTDPKDPTTQFEVANPPTVTHSIVDKEPGKVVPMTSKPKDENEYPLDPTERPKPWWKCWGLRSIDFWVGFKRCLALKPCREGEGCCSPTGCTEPCRDRAMRRCCYATCCPCCM